MNFVSLHPVEQQCQINFHINARNGGSRLWRGPQFKVQINLFTGTIHCEPNQVALNEFLLVWLEFQVKPLNRHLKFFKPVIFIFELSAYKICCDVEKMLSFSDADK
jgi:hypothetical protein